MVFITREGLKQLKRYKYSGGEYSWLDKQMNPFWYWCVDFLPMWMAPNLVTLIGFMFMIATMAIFISYDATF